MPPEKWAAACDGDEAAFREVDAALLANTKRMNNDTRPSTGQDIIKGRRTEIDYINGLVAAKGAEIGVPAPTHAAITEIVKRIERGEIEPGARNLENL
jgi:2-dehydropantoate 2-reductase